MHWMPKRENVIQCLTHAWHNIVSVCTKSFGNVLLRDITTEVYKAVSTKVVLQKHTKCTIGIMGSNSLVLLHSGSHCFYKQGKKSMALYRCVCSVWTSYYTETPLASIKQLRCMNQHYPKLPFGSNSVHFSYFCRTSSLKTAYLCPIHTL